MKRHPKYLSVIFVSAVSALFFISQEASGYKYPAECQSGEFIERQADVIVEGEIVKKETRKDKFSVHTYFDIKVLKYLKGTGKNIIIVKVYAGTMIGDKLVYPLGMALTQSEEGDKGIYYLKKIKNNEFSQDKYYTLTVCGTL